MNRLKNENGSTLIIVLLVLVIFTISVSLLSFQISNMSAQFKKTEKAIEAKHLANMGEEYYKAYVNKTVQDNPDPVDLYFLNTQFGSSPSSPFPKTVIIDSESKFEIIPLDIIEEGVDTFNIEYEIKGIVDEEEEAVNESVIKIEIW